MLQDNNQIRYKLNRIFQGITLLMIVLLVNSCAVYKSKKCGCPTFGNNHKHAHIETRKSEWLMASATNIYANQDNK